MVRLWAVGLLITSAAMASEVSAQSTVTFNKDVLPILQNNCQSCHRPGQVAPMSLLTFKDVRPWAKAIKAATVARKMPPWNADPRYGHYTNDRSLKQSAIDTLTKWVDAGAPEGDPNDAPPLKQWPSEGWEVQPDIILDGPDFDEATFVRDVEIISMMPHMHVRGKSMTYTLTYPDGKVEKILDVPHYDFNWQLKYDTSVRVPKGSKLRVDAHYDNSANNKYNPNPNRDVYYGEQTWEEMMIGYVGVLVDDPKLDPRQLFESIRR